MHWITIEKTLSLSLAEVERFTAESFSCFFAAPKVICDLFDALYIQCYRVVVDIVASDIFIMFALHIRRSKNAKRAK